VTRAGSASVRAIVTIQRRVQEPLALRILQGEFPAGETIRVDAQGDDLAFTRVVEAVPV
jgi:ATP-dependent Clp protease ATP-binding subunit ClpA